MLKTKLEKSEHLEKELMTKQLRKSSLLLSTIYISMDVITNVIRSYKKQMILKFSGESKRNGILCLISHFIK
jgi:hypothetical protein